MKRFLFFITALLILLNSINYVAALSGAYPAIYKIDFQPNFKGDFKFTFLSDSDIKSDMYVEGDLAKYVELDKKTIIGSDNIIATLKLPYEIDPPGEHTIYIGMRQMPAEETGGFGLLANVRTIIRVKVPYPGKYAETSLKTENKNAGDPVPITLTVTNLGKEDINAKAMAEISNYKQVIETLDFKTKQINSTQSASFFMRLNTTNYKPGDYNVTSVVYYEGSKPAKAISPFRLGELKVRINNYTKNFERNKLNKMEIEIESLWNNPIENVYATVAIYNASINFTTPSLSLAPWEINKLSGFFDTSTIIPDKFNAEIVLHYYDQETRETHNLRFGQEPANYTNYLIIGAIILVALIIILLIIIIVILIRRTKKVSKKIKK
jgi:hypothetical protein